MRSGPVFLLCLLTLSCAELQESKTPARAGKLPPDQVIWNGKIEVLEEGKLQSIIQAGQIKTYEKNKETILDSGVVIDFYNKRGQHTSKLTSRQARVQEMENLFLAEGDVVVMSDSGATLKTERLFWDREKQRIRSDTLVVMTSQYDSLQGYVFEANEDLTSWQLQQPTGQTLRRVDK